VCFLLAERFDEDPFLIFEWRGRSKQELLSRLRKNRAEAPAPAEPALEDFIDDFFTAGPLPPPPEPEDTEAVILRVDAPAIEVGGRPLIEALIPLYRQLTRDDAATG
jgi:uncharacterized Zn finger protein